MFDLLSVEFACALLLPTRIRWVYQLILQRIYNYYIEFIELIFYGIGHGEKEGGGTYNKWSGPTSMKPGLHT